MGNRILLFIPAYNCALQIGRVIGQLSDEVQSLLTDVLVVDNRSTDGTRETAVEALKGLRGVRASLLVNDANYGLGGSHKVAFLHAIENSFDHLVVLHGDDQGDVADILHYLRDGSYGHVDALLGARFMKGSRLVGYSAVRTLGNRVFNALYSASSGKRIHDLGSGLNLYKVQALRDRWWLRNADDLTFNYHMILRSIAAGWSIRFFPLSWREEDQVSNVKLVRQSMRVLSLPAAYLLRRRKYLDRDYSARPAKDYSAQRLYDSGPVASL